MDNEEEIILKKEKLFDNEGPIKHFHKFDNVHVLFNENTENAECVAFMNGYRINVT